MDNFDIFPTVVKLVLFKALFSIEVKQDLKIRQMNVVTVFAYNFLDKNIYIIQPSLIPVEEIEKMIGQLRKTL